MLPNRATHHTWPCHSNFCQRYLKDSILIHLIRSQITCLIRSLEGLYENFMWDKVFKNGPSEACGRQPLKNLKCYAFA